MGAHAGKHKRNDNGCRLNRKQKDLPTFGVSTTTKIGRSKLTEVF